MIEYPKTRNLNKRDGAKMLDGTYQLPEVPSILDWQAHEKIDGTNCRLDFRRHRSGVGVEYKFGGRTDNAQLHVRLHGLMNQVVVDGYGAMEYKLNEYGINSVTVFAEGIGPKIQGNLYGLTEHQLVAFDVLVNDTTWLPQDAVDEYANLLGIWRTPNWGMNEGHEPDTEYYATPEDWLDNWVRPGFVSSLNSETQAEGLILRPQHELRTQAGERVQIKLKTKDYRSLN